MIRWPVSTFKDQSDKKGTFFAFEPITASYSIASVLQITQITHLQNARNAYFFKYSKSRVEKRSRRLSLLGSKRIIYLARWVP
jgi:hypothetical protein